MYYRTLMAATLSGLVVAGTATLAMAGKPDKPEDISATAQRAETLYRQGVLQYEKGNLEAAIALYTDALELDPESAETYSARAGAWGVLEDYEAAIEDYSAAIDIDDELAPAYGGRGLARTIEGNMNAGVSDLWTAAQLFREQNQIEQYYKTLEIISRIAP